MNKYLLIFLAVVGGSLFYYFFFEKMFGVSIVLFAVYMYTIFFAANRKGKFNFLNSILFVSVMMIAGTFAIYSNLFLAPINILILPVLLYYHCTLLVYSRKNESRFSLVFVTVKKQVNALVTSIKQLKNMFLHSNKKYTNVKKVLLGLIISIPLLMLVMSLLVSSDDNFAHMVGDVHEQIFSALFDNPQLIVITVASLFLFTFLHAVQDDSLSEMKKKKISQKNIDLIITGTILTLLNVVYILFTVSQFQYFFTENPTSSAYTYAEYARKGFGELVIVTVINFIVLLVCVYFVQIKTKIEKVMMNSLLSGLVLFSVVMLCSAFRRLSLYELAYGFTYARFFVHIVMIVIGIFLFVAFIRIWFMKIPLLKFYLVMGLVGYVMLNYMSPDRMIIAQNMERYEETGKIDLDYMLQLSAESLPYMESLRGKVPFTSDIEKRIKNKYKFYEEWQQDFFSWNWSVQKVLKK